MPVLDPILQGNLLKYIKTNANNSNKNVKFYLRYLRIASRNKNRNFKTIEASVRFKHDLVNSKTLINDIFLFQYKNIDMDPTITDYYQYFFNQIDDISDFTSNDGLELKGNYIIQKNSTSIKFFQPNLFSSYRYWLFSNTPISILCINPNYTPDGKNALTSIQTLIKLEIDLMIAAGLTPILCATYTQNCHEFLFDLIERNQFTEVHINFHKKNELENFFVQLQIFSMLFNRQLCLFIFTIYR